MCVSCMFSRRSVCHIVSEHLMQGCERVMILGLRITGRGVLGTIRFGAPEPKKKNKKGGIEVEKRQTYARAGLCWGRKGGDMSFRMTYRTRRDRIYMIYLPLSSQTMRCLLDIYPREWDSVYIYEIDPLDTWEGLGIN